jgi:hypothetical protein
VNLLRVKFEDIPGGLKEQLTALTRDAFLDGQGQYDYGPVPPLLLILCVEEQAVIGHLATFVREMLVARRPMKLGLVGGVVVDKGYRRRGAAKAMVLESHNFFRSQAIEFSILFAIEPDIYRSSDYREMRNKTRFLDIDGVWREYVYRGGMVGELTDQPWEDQYLDLCGPTV